MFIDDDMIIISAVMLHYNKEKKNESEVPANNIFIDFNSFFVWKALANLTMSMIVNERYGESFRQAEEWQQL